MQRDGPDLHLAAVRAFVTVAEDCSFSEAAARLGLSQQAISKRVARLEADLGVVLFHRLHTGTELTEDGVSFLTHARALIALADQAVAMLRGRRRALRIDVLATWLASIDIVRGFHDAVGEVDLEIVTSRGLTEALPELARGSIDAFLGRATGALGEDIECTPAYLEPLHLLVGRRHPLAGRREVEMSELAGTTIWMPGIARPDTEWAEFYRFLGDEFAIRYDTSGLPLFGHEHLVERVGADGLVTFNGERTRLPWRPDVVQIPVTAPTPAYPWSLLWHGRNPHPALGLLISHISGRYRPYDPQRQWIPTPDRPHFTTVPKD
ncbi:LysR family transcriptional regulator [Actinoallomurus vinaceus]|uniref:LysR family transcriptional regulator n=1 Tax=Actinoallomurus vinaceus TaxID=1080074 RepID=UPI0031EBEAE3